MSADRPTYPVGKRISEFRKRKGLSVNKLANLAGISQSYLRDIEIENKNPTVEVVYTICTTLGITLRDFFDDCEGTDFMNDPLIERIYKLESNQRECLLAFLKSME